MKRFSYSHDSKTSKATPPQHQREVIFSRLRNRGTQVNELAMWLRPTSNDLSMPD